MIKRIWLVADDGDERPWRRALESPRTVAPLRVTESAKLPDLEPEPAWTIVGMAWFADADHLGRFDAWGPPPTAATVLDAEEVVVRGAGWLERRWAEGGDRLKHVAVARRRAGLSRTDFSRRWRAHAGRVGTRAIPDAARGLAYVQDHPVARAQGEWPHDAVTEVWFDDVDALRTRIAWMADALAAAPPDDLFGERQLFAISESVLR